MAPNVGTVAVVYVRFSICSLVFERPSRATLWLEHEQWYVTTAVQKGGVDGLLDVMGQLDVKVAVLKVSTTFVWTARLPLMLCHRHHGGATLLKGFLFHLRWSVLCVLLP